MAKQGGGLTKKIEELVKPLVESLGLEIWDVCYEKEGSEWFLKILIEKTDGSYMDIDSCEAASRAIDPLLDEADLIAESYYLEVGSPGLGRKLTKQHHLEKYVGEIIEAKLYSKDENGKKEIKGVLKSVDAEKVILEIDGLEREIAFKSAGSFKLCDDENLF